MLQRREARTAQGPLLIILAVFAGLCLAYSVLVPLGEAPDELAHYRYVHYVDQTGHPPLTATDRLSSGYKGHEPPLYYLLLHRATRPLRIAQQPMLKMLDPDREPQHSIASEVMLWNAVLHTADEAFPWQGTSLAWHMMRLLSIPLGMVTILCTYSIVRQLAPTRPWLAWLAAGLNALTPQFVYISAVMNNDNLAVPLSVLSLWILVRIARSDLRWRWFVLLGVVVGLARITKFYTLILVPIIWLALLIIAWRLRRWRRCLWGGLLVMALILAISAPWIMAVQPDDPATAPQGALGFGLKMLDILHTDRILRSKGMSASGGSAGGLASWANMLLSFFRLEPRRWLTLLFKSFWGFYGPMTVEAPAWFYAIVLAATLAALAGLVRLGWARSRNKGPGLLAPDPGLALAVLGMQGTAFVLLEALFYTIMRRLPDTAQGRHLYSAMPTWMFLLALGLAGWWPLAGPNQNALSRGERPAHIPRWSWAVLPALLGALTIYLLPTTVLSAYEPALPVRTSLPARWRPAVVLDRASAPGITLVGYGPASLQGTAGKTVTGSVLWRATARIQDEYLLRLAAVDAHGAAYTLYLAQPLNGRWPTRAWNPGDYIRDTAALTLPTGLPEGRYMLRGAWLTSQGQAIGEETDLGALHVQPSRSEGAGPSILIQGATEGIVSYRQSLVIDEVGPAEQRSENSAAGQLVGPGGQVWRPMAEQSFPAQDGRRAVRRFYLVTGHVQPGYYQRQASSIVAGGQRSNESIEVAGRARTFVLPEDYTRLHASLGEQIEVLGYRIEGAVWPQEAHPVLGPHYAALRPGQTLNLFVAWRAADWAPRSYTVFTHLLDERKIVRAQHDQVPRFDYATLFWVPGEVVTDLYHLALPTDAPAGVYEIEVGMYERLTSERLATRTSGGALDTRVVLTRILVSATATSP